MVGIDATRTHDPMRALQVVGEGLGPGLRDRLVEHAGEQLLDEVPIDPQLALGQAVLEGSSMASTVAPCSQPTVLGTACRQGR